MLEGGPRKKPKAYMTAEEIIAAKRAKEAKDPYAQIIKTTSESLKQATDEGTTMLANEEVEDYSSKFQT